MKPLKTTSSLSYRVKIAETLSIAGTAAQSRCAFYPTLGRTPKAPSDCSGAVPPADIPAPPPIAAWRRLRKPDPSVIPALTTAAPYFAASYVPPARHGLPQTTGQRSPPDEHPQQPDESCVPAAPRFADGLQSPFRGAPLPSGCTFTLVLSSATNPNFTCTICSSCKAANTRSSTPLRDQRFIRV